MTECCQAMGSQTLCSVLRRLAGGRVGSPRAARVHLRCWLDSGSKWG